MAAGDLLKLWKLHLIDHALLEVRSRAAALDPGRAIQAEIDLLSKEHAALSTNAKGLSAELSDLELQQSAIDTKIKKIDNDLYGGKVVNPREVENLQREIEALRRQKISHDERILELWELVPPAKSSAEEVEKRIEVAKVKLAEYQKGVKVQKAQLEREFAELSEKRPVAAKEVPPAMLARYESIRQKHGGIGMGRIVLKTKSCGACGTHLPEKVIESAKEERLVTCEACHRLVYYSESVI